MKVLLLAGGYGTRISEESENKPKPMIEIGGKPILWHIMKLYSEHGYNDFVVLLGYKGYVIKEYFANYFLHQSDVTIDTSKGTLEIHKNSSENWKVTLVETGLDTMTGGRIARAKDYVGQNPFMLTYGDGLSNVNIKELVRHHESQNKLLTVTAVQPEGRFGALDIQEDTTVKKFLEKPKGDGSWINGGFFVCSPGVFEYLGDDTCIFEREPLENLSADGQVSAFKHTGFWQPMDTLRDKNKLCELWDKNKAPWKVWEQ